MPSIQITCITHLSIHPSVFTHASHIRPHPRPHPRSSLYHVLLRYAMHAQSVRVFFLGLPHPTSTCKTQSRARARSLFRTCGLPWFPRSLSLHSLHNSDTILKYTPFPIHLFPPLPLLQRGKSGDVETAVDNAFANLKVPIARERPTPGMQVFDALYLGHNRVLEEVRTST